MLFEVSLASRGVSVTASLSARNVRAIKGVKKETRVGSYLLSKRRTCFSSSPNQLVLSRTYWEREREKRQQRGACIVRSATGNGKEPKEQAKVREREKMIMRMSCSQRGFGRTEALWLCELRVMTGRHFGHCKLNE